VARGRTTNVLQTYTYTDVYVYIYRRTAHVPCWASRKI